MCCLAYENDQYREIMKTMPKLNSKINTEKGVGVVSFIDIFKQKITVKFANESTTEYVEYTQEEFAKQFPHLISTQNQEQKDSEESEDNNEGNE